MRILFFVLLVSPLAACSSTYHPEYHPVTSTVITQSYATPLYVAESQSTTRQVISPSAAPQPIIIQAQPPPPASVDAMFDR